MSRSTAGRGGNERRPQEKEGCRVPQGGGFHRGAGGGNTYHYAYIIVFQLNQGRRKRKDVPFHGGEGGKRKAAAGEGRMSRSTGGREGGNTYRYAYIIVYKLNQGSRSRKDVPLHGGKRGNERRSQEKEGCRVPQEGGRGETHIVMPI